MALVLGLHARINHVIACHQHRIDRLSPATSMQSERSVVLPLNEREGK